MDIYSCQKRRRPDPLPHNDFNRISILMKESHRGIRLFLSVFILFVRGLFINTTA